MTSAVSARGRGAKPHGECSAQIRGEDGEEETTYEMDETALRAEFTREGTRAGRGRGVVEVRGFRDGTA